MNVLTKFQINIFNSRTPATPRTRRQILLSSTVPTPNKTIALTRPKMLNSTMNYVLKFMYFVLVVKRHRQNTYVTR